MIKRALRWLYPPHPESANSWGNPNEAYRPWNNGPGAFFGQLLTIALAVIVFSVVVVLLFPA